MPRRVRSAGIDWGESEESRAETAPVAADHHPLAAYVPWLERVALIFIRNRKMADVVACEQLIAAIKDLEEAAQPPRFDGTPSPFSHTPMAADVRHLIGGLRAVTRAISTGDLPLDEDLRAELAELVRDIVEVVMDVDLRLAAVRR